jgi:hypothetical protein
MERWQKVLIALLSAAVVALGAFSFGYSVAGGERLVKGRSSLATTARPVTSH